MYECESVSYTHLDVYKRQAVIFTIPYILYEYHKYGSILILRTGIVYTFIFYMLTSYFMTVLPLPPRSSVTPDTASVLLVPFDAIRRIITTANVTLSQPSTYVNLFKCFDFWQVAFNILLLFPFGVYPVSYTHLDVYKRQMKSLEYKSCKKSLKCSWNNCKNNSEYRADIK